MTRYSRSGHWRISKNGNRHWVEGHSVDRSPWPTSGGPSGTTFESIVSQSDDEAEWLPAVLWDVMPTEPNAVCPACGKPVWFYRNQQGGRASFIALGPAWQRDTCQGRTTAFDYLAIKQAKTRYEEFLAGGEKSVTGTPQADSAGDDLSSELVLALSASTPPAPTGEASLPLWSWHLYDAGGHHSAYADNPAGRGHQCRPPQTHQVALCRLRCGRHALGPGGQRRRRGDRD